MNKLVLILIVCISVTAQAQSVRSATECTGYPAFPMRFGFNPKTAALSSSEIYKRGLFLVDKSVSPKQSYQHPSWSQGGALGGITFDRDGNVYVFPTPHVELTYNPPDEQNALYRIDRESGEMTRWAELPTPHKSHERNVYGVLGATYSCFTDSFYVSSVMGSSRKEVLGVVYQLDGKTGKVLSRLEGFDGFGLAAVEIDGRRSLLLGSARDSHLYRVALSTSGAMLGRPEKIFSIVELGLRGDDKIKKITLRPAEGIIEIVGLDFGFNLSATLDRPESTYRFSLTKVFPDPIELLPSKPRK